ncbi:FliM/FliN family flagellar motor switch protein [uncultured Sulfitobacter sp.]|uniref:FliM/FliN family flagellar motor switch protein n=1 Tax=uncultured Sulfitobacter sp. TaxID=191468 RepID=UPI00262CD57F|nr:FliM/FliN family flagellar motor switch protein [uncultured Sulfitobacter sp.]
MSAEQTTTLVQRKARNAREAQAARTMSLPRALRLTAAKQADRLMGLPLSALSITRRTLCGDELPACLNDDDLILLMDGIGTQVAAVLLDPVLVAGLIQQQTMGKVRPAPEGDETRNATATDAALCAPFIEGLLGGAALLPDDAEEAAILKGYRFGVWAQEPRQAQLALDASDYTVIEMMLDMAAGTRAGKLVIILPEPARVAAVPDPDSVEAEQPISRNNLSENVMGLKADLMIALTRVKMPLQKASALKTGDLVDLNLSSMAQALVIDANGRAIARGTLGQIDGMRAVQVEQRNARQHTQPRRRAADRDELDLPDITGQQNDLPLMDELGDVGLPSFADMDVFGNLDDLPDLPDMDEAAHAADAQMAEWQAPTAEADGALKA